MLTPKRLLETLIKSHVPFLSPLFQGIAVAFEDLKSHMLDMVSEARAWAITGGSGRSNAALLRNLVEANLKQEGDTKGLSDEELLSNVFVSVHAMSRRIVDNI